MGGFISLLLAAVMSVLLAGCSPESNHPAGKPLNYEETVGPLQTSVVKRIEFHSQSLDQVKRMNVYLPKGYSSKKRYPVLYLIHGYSASETFVFSGLKTDQVLDKLIAEGKMEPLIVVSPEMDNSYGINSAPAYSVNEPGNPLTTYYGKYEDYLYKDVVGYVDSHFSTKSDREGRFIGGFSMGGFIALHTAFLHPELFGKAGGHSPALFLDDWSKAGGEQGLKAFLYPSDSLRAERDPIILAQKLNLSGLKVFLDCGEQDDFHFYEGTEKLFSILRNEGISAQYHKAPGKHDDVYWKSMLENDLLFYAS